MATIKEQLKEKIVKLGFDPKQVQVDYPARKEFGDYSTNVAMVKEHTPASPSEAIPLKRGLSGSPMEKAKSLVEELVTDKFIKDTFTKVEAVSPGFVNFFLKDEVLRREMAEIVKAKAKYGESKVGKGKKVLIEYSSPNTNKPLHVGHLRNNFLGMSLSKILEHQGFRVTLTEIVNDRGIHICKSMLAYQLWGEGLTPDKAGVKGDHFVGEYYVKYNEAEKKYPKIIEQARGLLQKWEQGDKDTRKLWQQMNRWAEAGYAQTYEKIGSSFDYKDHESDIFGEGKEIVLKALAEGLAKKVEGGAVAVDLSEYDLGGKADDQKILIRSDGTTMYMTQDLHLAVKRWQEKKPDKMLYIVGDEQIYHFKVLFKILEVFGNSWVKDRYYHIYYGQVNLPEGKMSSREGKVVNADDLIEEIEQLAESEIQKRNSALAKDVLALRSEKVSLAALKFFILKVDPKTTIIFDRKASIDFEGATGPYLLYTYARLKSILRKDEDIPRNTPRPPATPLDRGDLPRSGEGSYKFSEEERAILVMLSRFPEIVERCGEEYKPHYIAEYLLQLTSQTNSWYANSPVLAADEETKKFRLSIAQSISEIIKQGLKLLNIEVLETM